jgi:hypothetical protein
MILFFLSCLGPHEFNLVLCPAFLGPHIIDMISIYNKSIGEKMCECVNENNVKVTLKSCLCILGIVGVNFHFADLEIVGVPFVLDI